MNTIGKNDKFANRIKLKKSLWIICILLVVTLIPYTKSEAASASITISADSTSVVKGDEVYVSIKLSSEAVIGDFEAFLSYDPNILEFKSEASFISGGDGLVKISDINVENGDYTRKYVLKFTANAIGSSGIALKENANVYDFESGSTMSVSANELTIRVTKQKTASTNTKLKSLKISPGTLTPEFDPQVTEYTTSVKEAKKQLIVSAQAQDSSAIVTIEGTDHLKVGNNKITIKVKAESGDIKEYTINAECIASENDSKETQEETMDEETMDTAESNSDLVQIGDITALQDGKDIFIQNGFRYRICPIPNEDLIPEGYKKTAIMVNDITIEAYTPGDDLDSDFLLIYAENDAGDKGFYQYDRIEKTMQRYTGNNSFTSNKLMMSDEIIHSEEYKNKLGIMGIIIAVLAALLITMSIALIHAYTKQKE